MDLPKFVTVTVTTVTVTVTVTATVIRWRKKLEKVKMEQNKTDNLLSLNVSVEHLLDQGGSIAKSFGSKLLQKSDLPRPKEDLRLAQLVGVLEENLIRHLKNT